MSKDTEHSSVKSALVLARRNNREAMRVAAGLTIFDHEVELVFMGEPVSENDANSDEAELLELVDINPQTTVLQMKEQLPYLDSAGLADVLAQSDIVLNV